MDKTLAAREHQRLLEIAREYRRQGYNVTLAPTREQLPDFLVPFPVDMIAHHPQENVVVEVRSQESLAQAPELDAIAQAVQRNDHWRFELVVTNPRERNGLQIKDAKLLEQDDIHYRLQEIRNLVTQEYGEAAFLLTWSVLEAMLRRFAQAERIELVQDTPPHLIKTLFTYGLLSQEQYKILQMGLNTRNLLVHGYKVKQSFTHLLNDLLLIVEQLGRPEVLSLR